MKHSRMIALLFFFTCYTIHSSSIFDFIKPGELVFDIGAHVGNKTNEYLNNGARVVCIEPQPDCCQNLKQRFAKNPNVSIEPVGLSDKPGIMELSICSSSNTISTFSKEFQTASRHSQRGYRWDKTLSVPVSTFDALIEKYGMPQFCKIDVENYELQVLKGLTKPVPLLSIEFHVELFQHTVRCLDYLQRLGYTRFNFAAGENPNFVLKTWHNKEELIQEVITYSLTYYLTEKDPLWGDVYAQL